MICSFYTVITVAVFGTIVMLRWFRHREILALAEKGLLPVWHAQQPRTSRRLLGWGIGLAMLGVALVIGLWPMGLSDAMVGHYPLGFGPWMLAGLIPLFIGLGLVILYFIARRENGTPPEKTPEN